MSFKDVHDLQLAIDDLASLYPNASSDLTTICQQHVHGRYIETRSVSNALTLWNDVRSLVDWEGFSRSYPSFSNTFGYFFGRADRTEDKRRVEDIDTVSMFNLVCDLVYAGISQPPTEEEMARYITAVKGPSYHAIRYLGLVDYTKELEDEVKEALKHLQEMIVIQFSQHELQLIGMDVIGIEYALGRYFEAKTRLESEGMW
jgi:hypothetical protein